MVVHLTELPPTYCQPAIGFCACVLVECRDWTMARLLRAPGSTATSHGASHGGVGRDNRHDRRRRRRGRGHGTASRQNGEIVPSEGSNRIFFSRRLCFVLCASILVYFFGVWSVTYDFSLANGANSIPSDKSATIVQKKNTKKYIKSDGSKARKRKQPIFQTCAESIEALSSATNVYNQELFRDHPAIQCLRQTAPSVKLQYPLDALKHFKEIHKTILEDILLPDGITNTKYHDYAGYSGPRIENYWISTFYEKHLPQIQNGTACLPNLYGPFIPLFIPWVEKFATDYAGYTGFIRKVLPLLRKDVPYIAVSQNDEGIGGYGLKVLDEFPNILVLSAGGYGHVPIPLLNQVEPPLSLDDKNHLRIPIENRTSMINYVGKLVNAPRDLRKHMNEILSFVSTTTAIPPSTATTPITIDTNDKNSTNVISRLFQRHPASVGPGKQQVPLHPTKMYEYSYSDNWRQIMANSFFSLVPRGYGRTAFHFMETLQMGLIPIQVYSDLPWIPYANLLLGEDGDDADALVYATKLEDLQALVGYQLLPRLTKEYLERKEARILSLRESHFMPAGIMSHIQAFVSLDFKVQETTDLVCQKLPATVRDA